MKVKDTEINRYWREKKNRCYAMNRPDLQVRHVTKDFLTKKQTLVDNGCEDLGEEDLLNDLLDNIRAILTKESTTHTKAKRKAGVE